MVAMTEIQDLAARISESFENLGDLDVNLSSLIENYETMLAYVQKVQEKFDDL